MRIYFKILFTAGIILITSGFFNCKTSQQVVSSDKLDENRLVYWFYVSVREIKGNNTDLTAYDLTRIGNIIENGTAKKYEYLLWKNLSEGRRLAVGPFNDPVEAKQAFLFYKIQDKPHNLDATFDLNRKVFWFVLKVSKRERSVTIKLERIPGAIATGKYSDFDVFLKENLNLGVMTIGPFRNMPDGEESKRIYRLY